MANVISIMLSKENVTIYDDDKVYAKYNRVDAPVSAYEMNHFTNAFKSFRVKIYADGVLVRDHFPDLE